MVHYKASRRQATVKSTVQSSGEAAEGVARECEEGGGVAGQRSRSVESLTGIEYGERGEGEGEEEGEAGKKAADYIDPFGESDSDSDEQLWRPMWVAKTIVITDESEIFDTFNPNWLKWPDAQLAQRALKSSANWRAQEGMEGEVVHEWRPFHIEAAKRSHIDKVILLVKTADEQYVLVREQGVKEV